jgi:hypothetical protein
LAQDLKYPSRPSFVPRDWRGQGLLLAAPRFRAVVQDRCAAGPCRPVAPRFFFPRSNADGENGLNLCPYTIDRDSSLRKSCALEQFDA